MYNLPGDEGRQFRMGEIGPAEQSGLSCVYFVLPELLVTVVTYNNSKDADFKEKEYCSPLPFLMRSVLIR